MAAMCLLAVATAPLHAGKSPDLSTWSKDDVSDKKFLCTGGGVNIAFHFLKAGNIAIANVDTGMGAPMRLGCHWRVKNGRLDVFEEEEKFWSFQLVARKPTGFTVKDSDGKVMELKAAK